MNVPRNLDHVEITIRAVPRPMKRGVVPNTLDPKVWESLATGLTTKDSLATVMMVTAETLENLSAEEVIFRILADKFPELWKAAEEKWGP